MERYEVEQAYFAENSELSLSEIVETTTVFALSRPVFTLEELYGYVSQQHDLNIDIDTFENHFLRYLKPTIMQDLGEVGAEWISGRGKDGREYIALDTIGPALPQDSVALERAVKDELNRLFAGRRVVGSAEILFYLRSVQGLGNEAVRVLGMLYSAGFVAKASGGYKLPLNRPAARFEPEPESESLPAPPHRVPTIKETFEEPPVDSAPSYDTQLNTPKGGAPKFRVPNKEQQRDLPFNAQERSIATLVLNRLQWETARQDGVWLQSLIDFCSIPGVTTVIVKNTIIRLWRRGYVWLDAADPQNIRLFLSRHELAANREWQDRRSVILQKLSEDFGAQ